jgi:hypothetical protein
MCDEQEPEGFEAPVFEFDDSIPANCLDPNCFTERLIDWMEKYREARGCTCF